MKYVVTAVSVDPKFPNTFSEAREEVIDTEDNELFRGANGPWDVEDIYHRYWNRLNDRWENAFPEYKEKVLVISVEQA